MEDKELFSYQEACMWFGELHLSFKLAQRQVELLTAENARLNTLLSKCKCQVENEE